MPIANDTFADQLKTALRRHPHLQRNDLSLENEGGNVVVRGRVGSYFQKQMAQETLRRIEGVEHIDNLLEVHWA